MHPPSDSPRSPSAFDPTRTLYIDYNHNKSSEPVIYDSDKVTPLFHVSMQRKKKPHLEITSATTGDLIGAADFPRLQYDVEYSFGSPPQHHVLKPNLKSFKHKLKSGYTFPAPFPAEGSGNTTSDRDPSQSWSWCEDSEVRSHLVCTDVEGVPVAKFATEPWSLKTAGRMERRIELTATVDGLIKEAHRRVMEVVILTAYAMSEFKKQEEDGASVGAAALGLVALA